MMARAVVPGTGAAREPGMILSGHFLIPRYSALRF